MNKLKDSRESVFVKHGDSEKYLGTNPVRSY